MRYWLMIQSAPQAFNMAGLVKKVTTAPAPQLPSCYRCGACPCPCQQQQQQYTYGTVCPDGAQPGPVQSYLLDAPTYRHLTDLELRSLSMATKAIRTVHSNFAASTVIMPVLCVK